MEFCAKPPVPPWASCAIPECCQKERLLKPLSAILHLENPVWVTICWNQLYGTMSLYITKRREEVLLPNITVMEVYRVFPKIRQRLILIFAPKNLSRAYFQGMFYCINVQQSTFTQMQSCHILLLAAQRWRAGFHLTRAYFWVELILQASWKIILGLFLRLGLIFGETVFHPVMHWPS